MLKYLNNISAKVSVLCVLVFMPLSLQQQKLHTNAKMDWRQCLDKTWQVTHWGSDTLWRHNLSFKYIIPLNKFISSRSIFLILSTNLSSRNPRLHFRFLPQCRLSVMTHLLESFPLTRYTHLYHLFLIYLNRILAKMNLSLVPPFLKIDVSGPSVLQIANFSPPQKCSFINTPEERSFLLSWDKMSLW